LPAVKSAPAEPPALRGMTPSRIWIWVRVSAAAGTHHQRYCPSSGQAVGRWLGACWASIIRSSGTPPKKQAFTSAVSVWPNAPGPVSVDITRISTFRFMAASTMDWMTIMPPSNDASETTDLKPGCGRAGSVNARRAAKS
jgi:hypothetical protein